MSSFIWALAQLVLLAGSGALVAGGLYAFYNASELTVTASLRRLLGRFLAISDVRPLSPSMQRVLAGSFESVFGMRTLSARFIARSVVATVLSWVAFLLLWAASDRNGLLEVSRGSRSLVDGLAVSAYLASITLVAGYLSLAKTKFLLARLRIFGRLGILVATVVDAWVSLEMWMMGVGVGYVANMVLWYYEYETTFLRDMSRELESVSIYRGGMSGKLMDPEPLVLAGSTFLPWELSAWATTTGSLLSCFYFLSLFAVRTGVQNTAFISQRREWLGDTDAPFRLLGTVACLVAAALYSVAAPFIVLD